MRFPPNRPLKNDGDSRLPHPIMNDDPLAPSTELSLRPPNDYTLAPSTELSLRPPNDDTRAPSTELSLRPPINDCTRSASHSLPATVPASSHKRTLEDVSLDDLDCNIIKEKKPRYIETMESRPLPPGRLSARSVEDHAKFKDERVLQDQSLFQYPNVSRSNMLFYPNESVPLQMPPLQRHVFPVPNRPVSSSSSRFLPIIRCPDPSSRRPGPVHAFPRATVPRASGRRPETASAAHWASIMPRGTFNAFPRAWMHNSSSFVFPAGVPVLPNNVIVVEDDEASFTSRPILENHVIVVEENENSYTGRPITLQGNALPVQGNQLQQNPDKPLKTLELFPLTPTSDTDGDETKEK